MATLSTDGTFKSLSPPMALATGWSEADCVGRPLPSLLHPLEAERVNACWVQVAQGDTVALGKTRWLARDDSYLTWTVSFVPCRKLGVVTEVLILGYATNEGAVEQNGHSARGQEIPRLFAENSERQKPGAESGTLSTLLESLLANAPIGFALLDENLDFVCLNRAFSELTAFSPEQQLGQSFARLLPGAIHPLMAIARGTLLTGTVALEHPIVFPRAEGVGLSRDALVSFYPIPDSRGGNCGVAAILVDITERKRSDERLKRVSDELQRSNEALGEFCYIASHDLNEPLRTIATFVELLKVRCRGKLGKDADEYIDFAVSGAQRMRRLIDGILKYSRAGKLQRGFSDVDCAALLRAVQASLATTIEESGVRITCDPLPSIRGDLLLLTQVFQNLIENAIKYRSAEPLHIHVGVAKELHSWVFSVRDNGIGIDGPYLESIFTPFRRLHSTSEFAGSGLGLAICRKNVERHQGKIWASSAGKGATFHFSLPIAPSEESDADGSGE